MVGWLLFCFFCGLFCGLFFGGILGMSLKNDLIDARNRASDTLLLEAYRLGYNNGRAESRHGSGIDADEKDRKNMEILSKW